MTIKDIHGDIQRHTWRHTKTYMETYKDIHGDIQRHTWRHTKTPILIPAVSRERRQDHKDVKAVGEACP